MLWPRCFCSTAREPKLRVAYDPDDLGEIQVWAPDAQDPLTVRAINHAMASGQTLRRHKALQAKARELGHQSEDRDAVQRAKQDLVQEIDALMSSRKQKDRRKAAALKGVSSTQKPLPAEGSTPPPAIKNRTRKSKVREREPMPQTESTTPDHDEFDLSDLVPMSGFSMIRREPPKDDE